MLISCSSSSAILPQVDIHSLEEYVDMVVEATVGNGIRRQMEAFRDGFNQVSGGGGALLSPNSWRWMNSAAPD